MDTWTMALPSGRLRAFRERTLAFRVLSTPAMSSTRPFRSSQRIRRLVR